MAVRIAGITDLKNLRGVQPVVLPEGRYQAEISGPVQQQLDFTIRSSYFSRWFSDPVWVLNPGGEAILICNRAVYGRNPPPATVSFHFGKAFEYFDGVTHPFQPLPQTLSLHENEQRTLVNLELYRDSGLDVLDYYLGQRQPNLALNFAEQWLRGHNQDGQMLRAYAALAEQHQETNRLDAFLRSGLDDHPVRVEWHRLYQQLHNHPSSHDALVAEYDARLRADPQNSALLYLRGRIEGNRLVCRGLFERACQADSGNAYAFFGLGFDRMFVADWAGARPLLARACELQPADKGFQHWLLLTRFALGEASAIEQEARQQIAAKPLDFMATVQLIDALAAQDRRPDALEACAGYERTCAAKYSQGPGKIINAIRRHTFYVVGDFASLEKNCAGDESPAGRTARVEALIELNRIADATRLVSSELEEDQITVTLALAIACRLAGDAIGAEHWQAQASQLLANGDEDSIQAAALLERNTPPTHAEARDLALMPQLKAELLADLALKHPQARNDLAPLARQLNVQRTFPFHLVQRATAEQR